MGGGRAPPVTGPFVLMGGVLKVLPTTGSAPQPKVVFIMWVMPAGRPGSKRANVELLNKPMQPQSMHHDDPLP